MNISSIKDFEILQEIGKGAFANVYKVRRIKDGEIYALKKVYMHKLKQKEKENSLNEIRILASINHTNVIQYYDAFYDSLNNCLCIAMEYAEMGDLEKKISKNIKQKIYLPEEEIVNIFYQIVLGLKVLHDKKILHRDIKAANIFLFKDNVVKIGDLNVSKVVKMGMMHTQTGTPYYASPEVWNNKPYDYKSDIWSLGCLLYEMTTLNAPFRGNTMKAVYDKVIKGVYDPIPSVYSKELIGIIYIMLQNNPANRPNCDLLLALIQERLRSNKTIKPITRGNIPDSTNNILDEKPDDYKGTIDSETNNGILTSVDKLLNTIRIPKRMADINKYLPRSRFFRKSLHSPISLAGKLIFNENKVDIIKKKPESNQHLIEVENGNNSTADKNGSSVTLKQIPIKPYSAISRQSNGVAKIIQDLPSTKPIIVKPRIYRDKLLPDTNNDRSAIVKRSDVNVSELTNNENSHNNITYDNPTVDKQGDQRKIVNLKDNYHFKKKQEELFNNKFNNIIIDTKVLDKLEERSISPISNIVSRAITPTYISKHERNNSTNIKRIFHYDSNTPSVDVSANLPKLDHSYIHPNDKSAIVGNHNLDKPKNLFLNNNKNITPINHKLPLRIVKDKYNFKIHNYDLKLDIPIKNPSRNIILANYQSNRPVNNERLIIRDYKLKL